MRTHEVADRAGVNAQTLRYYERRGLLAEPPRSPAGYRDYPTSVVGVVRFVKRSQELGFTLTEVEELLSLAEGGPDSCDRPGHWRRRTRPSWTAGSRICTGCARRWESWSRPVSVLARIGPVRCWRRSTAAIRSPR
jgi:DNA-binding transcriptional MerR regulator